MDFSLPKNDLESCDAQSKDDEKPAKDSETWECVDEDDSGENKPGTSLDKVPSPRKSGQIDVTDEAKHLNVTDEEKERRLALDGPQTTGDQVPSESLANKPFLETALNSLNYTKNDYPTLFTLCLFYAIAISQVQVSVFKVFIESFKGKYQMKYNFWNLYNISYVKSNIS